MISYEYMSDPKFHLRKTAELKKKLFHHLKNALLRLPFTKLPWSDIAWQKYIESRRNIKEWFVIGMGGSSLSAKVLCELFAGRVPVIFVDNIEPATISRYLRGDSKYGYFITSKSGETIEVLSLAKILFAKKIPRENFLVLTDEPKSTLAKLAKKKKIKVVIGERDIPGRFSVLGKSGLLPLLLTNPEYGFRTVQYLLAGAQNALWENAFTLAACQYFHAKEGKNIVVLFSYCERMSVFIDWYIQLLSESIGKSKTVGITPVKAIGVKDQHSQLQLFLDGPKDKFFILLKEDSKYGDVPIPGEKYTLGDLFSAEYEGVLEAFWKKAIPFVEIRFPLLSPEVVGELMFFFELEVAFLGSLFKVNFQNQPAVELSKRYTKNKLPIS